MSLRMVDGFDHYAAGSIGQKWTYGGNSTPGLSMITGRTGSGQALQFAPGGSPIIVRQQLDSQGSWVFGFAYSLANQASDRENLIFADWDSGTIQGCIAQRRDYKLELRRGQTTVVATTTATLNQNTWYFIELKHIINGTTGILELRVNGAVWATFTGNTQATGNATANQFSLFAAEYSFGGSAVYRFDDFYACDGQGSVNNDYLGDCKVVPLYPNGAGADTAFTQVGGTAGSAWTAVNESNPDGDTSYLSSANVGDSETLAFQNLTGSPTIKGVVLTLDARKDDVGTRTLQGIARPGATDHLGVAFTPTTSYLMYQTAWDVNPDTSAAWTASDVNATEFGIKNAS